MRIADIRLGSRDILDVPGIDDLSTNGCRLQGGIRAPPVNAGAFHDDCIRIQCRSPFGQGPPIPLECAELPLFDVRGAIGLIDERTGRDLRLVHIESDNAFVKRSEFYLFSLLDKSQTGRQRMLN